MSPSALIIIIVESCGPLIPAFILRNSNSITQPKRSHGKVYKPRHDKPRRQAHNRRDKADSGGNQADGLIIFNLNKLITS
jgi:hypothetical protein